MFVYSVIESPDIQSEEVQNSTNTMKMKEPGSDYGEEASSIISCTNSSHALPSDEAWMRDARYTMEQCRTHTDTPLKRHIRTLETIIMVGLCRK